jgi:hypothetical protein
MGWGGKFGISSYSGFPPGFIGIVAPLISWSCFGWMMLLVGMKVRRPAN